MQQVTVRANEVMGSWFAEVWFDDRRFSGSLDERLASIEIGVVPDFDDVVWEVRAILLNVVDHLERMSDAPSQDSVHRP